MDQSFALIEVRLATPEAPDGVERVLVTVRRSLIQQFAEQGVMYAIPAEAPTDRSIGGLDFKGNRFNFVSKPAFDKHLQSTDAVLPDPLSTAEPQRNQVQ